MQGECEEGAKKRRGGGEGARDQEEVARRVSAGPPPGRGSRGAPARAEAPGARSSSLAAPCPGHPRCPPGPGRVCLGLGARAGALPSVRPGRVSLRVSHRFPAVPPRSPGSSAAPAPLAGTGTGGERPGAPGCCPRAVRSGAGAEPLETFPEEGAPCRDARRAGGPVLSRLARCWQRRSGIPFVTAARSCPACGARRASSRVARQEGLRGVFHWSWEFSLGGSSTCSGKGQPHK